MKITQFSEACGPDLCSSRNFVKFKHETLARVNNHSDAFCSAVKATGKLLGDRRTFCNKQKRFASLSDLTFYFAVSRIGCVGEGRGRAGIGGGGMGGGDKT